MKMIDIFISYLVIVAIIYTNVEDIKISLLWPYTLTKFMVYDIFGHLKGKIILKPKTEFHLIFLCILVGLAFYSPADWVRELYLSYLVIMFAVFTNILNLPESLLWPYTTLKFIFKKCLAIFSRIRSHSP